MPLKFLVKQNIQKAIRLDPDFLKMSCVLQTRQMVTKELILHFLDSWKHQTQIFTDVTTVLSESEQTLFHNSAAKAGSTELLLFAEN